MGKILGYAIMLVGVIVLILPIIFKSIVDSLKIPAFWVMIVGLGIMALGFVFLKPSSSSKSAKQSDEEVPIYHGNKIVGYRRAHK